MNENIPARLDPLTSLRFFAAAMIVMLHGVGRGIGPEWLGHFALGQGVSFFYVLSGFVLAYNYPRLDNAASVKSFYVARIARIWPSHVMSAVLFVLLISQASYFSLPSGTRDLITITYVTMTNAWVPVSSFIVAYNAVAWSISTEWFFYLAFPLLVANWNATRYRKLGLMLGLAAGMCILGTLFPIAPNGTEEGRTNLMYINPLGRIFEFTLGIAVCHLYREAGARFSSRVSPDNATLLEVATIAGVVLSLWLSRYLANVVAESGTSAAKTAAVVLAGSGFGTFVFAFAIFVFAVGGGAISRVLRLRPMTFLGEISFALYLMHTLFLLYRQQAPAVFDGLSGLQLYLLYWAVALGLSVMLHLGIERPAQTLIRDWYAGRIRRSLARSLAAMGAFVLAIGVLVLAQPSARFSFPSGPAEGVALLPAPVDFEAGYRLESVEGLHSADGRPTALRFSWTATADRPLDRRVAVHQLDAQGKMVGQLDFAMETGYRSAARGERWSNRVPLPASDLPGVDALGIAVYKGAALSLIRAGQGTSTDWNGQRLVVPVGAMRKSPAPPPGESFASNVTLADITGSWKAGKGVGTIAVSADGKLALVTEAGLKGVGSLRDDRIDVPGWKVSGRLSADRRRILWSNTFVWHRPDEAQPATQVR